MSPESPKRTGDQQLSFWCVFRYCLVPNMHRLGTVSSSDRCYSKRPNAERKSYQPGLLASGEWPRGTLRMRNNAIAGRGRWGQARSLNSCLPAPCSSIISRGADDPKVRREPRGPSDQNLHPFLGLHACATALLSISARRVSIGCHSSLQMACLRPRRAGI